MRRDRFSEIIENPTHWLMQGQLLMRSAFIMLSHYSEAYSLYSAIAKGAAGKILVDDWRVHDYTSLHLPLYMLAGMSLEAMFKGVIIKKGLITMSKGKRVKWTGGTGHELLDLAKLADIPDRNEKLLCDLQEFIIWKGKYPASWSVALYDSLELINFGGTLVFQNMIIIDEMYHSAKLQVHPDYGRTRWI